MGIDVDLIKQVEIVYHLTQAVTHLGEDVDGQAWTYYQGACPEHRAFFARAFALLYFFRTHNEQAVVAFRHLAAHRSTRYDLWQAEQDTLPENLEQAFIETRNGRPPAWLRSINPQ